MLIRHRNQYQLVTSVKGSVDLTTQHPPKYDYQYTYQLVWYYCADT